MPKKLSYELRFVKRPAWLLTGEPKTEKWLAKFADILGLTSSATANEDGKMKIHFTHRNMRWSPPSKNRIGMNCVFGGPLDAPYMRQKFPFMRISSEGPTSSIGCEVDYGLDQKSAIRCMRYGLHPIRRHAMEGGGLPIHSALIERDGDGFLLAGPSGMGKSTCCQRIASHWNVLCDDEVLVIRDDNSEYHCHPFPTWSDYLEDRAENTWNVQRSVPLRKLFFIEQSDSDRTIPLGHAISAVWIYESTVQIYGRYWIHLSNEESSREKRLAFENACEMAKLIPAYILRVSINGRFWEEMERVIDEL